MTASQSRAGAAVFLAAAAHLLAMMPLPSEAAPRVCQRLEAELASLDDGSPRLEEYDEAVISQREEVAAARDEAEEAGCGYGLRGETVRQCARLNARIERMEHRLERLQRKLDRTVGRTEKSRRQLLAELEVNGCQPEEWSVEPPRDELESPNAVPEYDPPYEDYDPDRTAREREPLPYEEYNQSFRTMCVRTCDGFFFPMSNAATIGEFQRDQKSCEAACPGTEVRLFYGPAGSEGAAEMTSTATGQPYSELPTAFLHQKISSPRPQGCGCKAKRDYEVLGGTSRPTILNRSAPSPVTETSKPSAEPDQQASGPARNGPSIIAIPMPEPSADRQAQGSSSPQRPKAEKSG